jgi:hypothetical protein
VIRTTAEHPFYVNAKGWVEAGSLQAGDLLSSHDGRWVAVEESYDTGEYETVYNMRVASWHTYFVGGDQWGFSLWAHNNNRNCGKDLFTGELVSHLKSKRRVSRATPIPSSGSNTTFPRPMPGMGSGVHPDLPVIAGGKTLGIFSSSGTTAQLQSGANGPGAWLKQNLRNGKGSGLNDAVTHVEGHAAGIMHQHNIMDADLFINMPGGPCEAYCRWNLYKFLPPGSKLRVHFPNPDGSVGIWEFTGGIRGWNVLR